MTFSNYIPNISQLLHANQYLIKTLIGDDYYLVFRSYSTNICYYNPTTKELTLNWDMWDYSKTTLRHLYYFLRSYTIYDCSSKKDVLVLIQNGTFKTFRE